jgi:hypothetical protein
MPKGKGYRESKKTIKRRFKDHAKVLIGKGGISRSGKKLSTKEIGRRAMARAERDHAAAAGAREKFSGNANLRAFASKRKDFKGKEGSQSKSVRKLIGKSIRRERTRANQDLSTGKQQTALKAGRVAVKRSVSRGDIKKGQGRRALRALAAVDPSTRRSLVGSAAETAANKSGGGRGGFTTRKGQAISRAVRAAKKKAAGKTTNKTTKKTVRAPRRSRAA